MTDVDLRFGERKGDPTIHIDDASEADTDLLDEIAAETASEQGNAEYSIKWKDLQDKDSKLWTWLENRVKESEEQWKYAQKDRMHIKQNLMNLEGKISNLTKDLSMQADKMAVVPWDTMVMFLKDHVELQKRREERAKRFKDTLAKMLGSSIIAALTWVITHFLDPVLCFFGKIGHYVIDVFHNAWLFITR